MRLIKVSPANNANRYAMPEHFCAPENQLLDWLSHGERDTPSETLFLVLTGQRALEKRFLDYPKNAAQLRCCRLLLEQCPSLLSQFSKMASISPAWQLLVMHWDLLCQTQNQESPRWQDGLAATAKTNQLLQEVLHAASIHC